jgi:hypothetical protein
MLDPHSLASLHIRDQLVDLVGVQRALDPQHNRQRHHDIAVRQQQIARRNIAVRDEGLDCLLAGADQRSVCKPVSVSILTTTADVVVDSLTVVLNGVIEAAICNPNTVFRPLNSTVQIGPYDPVGVLRHTCAI